MQRLVDPNGLDQRSELAPETRDRRQTYTPTKESVRLQQDIRSGYEGYLALPELLKDALGEMM